MDNEVGKMQQKYGGGDKKVERNIEARSDGFSFRVRMKIGSTYVNETFFSLEEARAYRDLLRAGKATDKDQEKVLKAKAEKKKAASMTIGTLLDRYLKEVSIHKKGHKDEAYSIGRLQRIKSFSSLPVYLADGDTIERLKHDIRACKPVSDTTMRKYLMLVSHMFKIAMTRRWCKDLQNPVKTVELPRPARMRSRRFDTDEFTYLCAELSRARNALVLPFFEFLVETACRRGEALRLRVMDVDMNARTAILIDTKNGEDRTIGLNDACWGRVKSPSATRQSADSCAPPVGVVACRDGLGRPYTGRLRSLALRASVLRLKSPQRAMRRPVGWQNSDCLTV